MNFESPLQVKLADGSILYFHGTVGAHLSVFNGTEKINIMLKDVLSLPKLQNKLFSLPSGTEKGASVFNSKEKRVELLWYLRYGHFNKSMVNGMSISSKEIFDRNCEDCAMGKQPRQPFSRKLGIILIKC